MAAGPKLDGSGTVKLITLEEALTELQPIHGLVERMAIEVKNGKPISGMTGQLKRLATPLQGKLKMQFQLIGDLVTALIMVGGRGGADTVKLRAYREYVAQIRTQIEIAIIQTKEKHKVEDEEDSSE
jgi:hypothetical protein